MHEATADGARSRVQVLVAAPNGEVGRIAMQSERHVADRVREVEADRAAVASRQARERADLEPLAAQVLHARQEDQRDALTFALEQLLEALDVQLEGAA